MRLIAGLSFGYIAVAVACAAQQAAPAVPDAPKTEGSLVTGQGRITGTIYCNDTNKPARGAWVQISKSGSGGRDEVRELSTVDAEGHFAFSHISPGGYEVRVGLNGYLFEPSEPAVDEQARGTQSLDEAFNAHAVLKVDSSETVKFDAVLRRSGALSGQVFFDDGGPAMGADVLIERVTSKAAQPGVAGGVSYEDLRSSYGGAEVTDDRGNFRVTTLPPGKYVVAAVPKLQNPLWMAASGVDVDDEYANAMNRPSALAVFSGDTAHRAEATVYEVRDGVEISGIAITIPLAKLHRIGGTLSTTDGRTPNMGMIVMVDNADSEIRFVAGLQKDGSFVFTGVPSGTYKLSFQHIFIGKPDTRTPGYSEDDYAIPVAAFSGAGSSIIVKDGDVLDLHFELDQVPLPAKKTGAKP